MPDGYFAGKRILVFDDMMRTGKHLVGVLEDLHNRGLWNLAENNVRVAVFAIHEESSGSRTFHDQPLPHGWFYSNLPTSSYREVRTQVRLTLRERVKLLFSNCLEVGVVTYKQGSELVIERQVSI